jgi:hypothetical protein
VAVFEGIDVKGFSGRTAKVECVWIDKVHTFRLGLDQLFELDELTGEGPYERLRALREGTWKTRLIRETIRLGLIGGGMEPNAARLMVERYVDARPLGESQPIALLISTAAVLGVLDDPPGKPKGAADRPARRSRKGD